MDINEVKHIFDHEKEGLLYGVQPVEHPVAYILGGQPSSGKSSLIGRLQGKGRAFAVNGDSYRLYHPDHDRLILSQQDYSRETQVFSNVFTEGFIEEAIRRRFSIIVEGTMRDPEVVTRTVSRFAQAGFRVEAHCIASPEEYTGINLFARYASEVALMGAGRLADRSTHDRAVTSLLKTLDRLYAEREVHRIALYEIFGRRLALAYELLAGGWSLPTLPSEAVEHIRQIQLEDVDLRQSFLTRGQAVLQQGCLTSSEAKELEGRLACLLP